MATLASLSLDVTASLDELSRSWRVNGTVLLFTHENDISLLPQSATEWSKALEELRKEIMEPILRRLRESEGTRKLLELSLFHITQQVERLSFSLAENLPDTEVGTLISLWHH